MEISIKRPLFIGCHPDDNIIGCGGILSRLSKSGDEFHCYTFSCNNDSRRKEWETAMNYLNPTTKKLYEFKGDSLPDHRYEIRSILETLKKTINPDTIFTHSRKSLHQSHVALSEEVERIMRNTSILTHEGIKGGPNLTPNMFIEITEKELQEKIKLISFMETEKKKYFLQEDLIRSVARIYGGSIGVKYAEGFEVVRIKA